MAGRLRELDVEARLVGDAQGLGHVQVKAHILRAAQVGDGEVQRELGAVLGDEG